MTPRRTKLSVLLTTEGTYPYHGGGVSTWCHALTHRLPGIDFTIFSVAMHPYLRLRYTLASNVGTLVTVPLWGTADPAESRPGLSYTAFLERRASASTERARHTFNAAWRSFVAAVLSRQDTALTELTDAVVRLHQHFVSHDYRSSFRDHRAWEVFVETVTAAWRAEYRAPEPSLADLLEAFKLTYRFLIVLDARSLIATWRTQQPPGCAGCRASSRK